MYAFAHQRGLIKPPSNKSMQHGAKPECSSVLLLFIQFFLPRLDPQNESQRSGPDPGLSGFVDSIDLKGNGSQPIILLPVLHLFSTESRSQRTSWINFLICRPPVLFQHLQCNSCQLLSHFLHEKDQRIRVVDRIGHLPSTFQTLTRTRTCPPVDESDESVASRHGFEWT